MTRLLKVKPLRDPAAIQVLMKLKGTAILFGLMGALELASCEKRSERPSSFGPSNSAAEATTAKLTPEPTTERVPTIVGDVSQVSLKALTPEMVGEAKLPGELGCSFNDAEGAVLLVARADVSDDGAVAGVVNNNDSPEGVTQARAKGFNDLLDGIDLAGKGLTLKLTRGKKIPTGHEGSTHEARLVVRRAGGAERTYDGLFHCGP